MLSDPVTFVIFGCLYWHKTYKHQPVIIIRNMCAGWSSVCHSLFTAHAQLEEQSAGSGIPWHWIRNFIGFSKVTEVFNIQNTNGDLWHCIELDKVGRVRIKVPETVAQMHKLLKVLKCSIRIKVIVNLTAWHYITLGLADELVCTWANMNDHECWPCKYTCFSIRKTKQQQQNPVKSNK